MTHTAVKCLLGVLFSLTLSPEDETVVKVPTLTGKVNQHSNVCSITFLCRRDPVTLCLSGNFLETWGHTMSVNQDTGLWWQNLHLSLCGPYCGMALQLFENPSNCCFLTSDSSRFAPPFGISEASGRLATPRRRPICSRMSPQLGNHSMAPSTLRHTPIVCFLMRRCGVA